MDELEIRLAQDDEFDRVVQCCAAALGWKPGEPNADFFRWKHRDNHFGPSPIWVALDHGEIVGVRALMRWELRRGTEMLAMVRAVDTATLPTHQGRGIFKKLTTAAIDVLRSEGVDAVFNTPNDQSRPGYLKMGWTDVGRVPVGLAVRTPLVLPRLLRSRVAAGKWGVPLRFGTTTPDLGALAGSWMSPTGWHTPISEDYLAWRYGFEPLGYRFTDNAVIRLRSRGSIKELSVCETFGDAFRPRPVLRATGADVAVATGLALRDGFIPTPQLGPRLTWRVLARPETPTMSELDLSLGTIELF